MRKQVLGLSIAILLLAGTSAQAQSEYGKQIGSYLAVSAFAAYDDRSDLGDYDDVNGGVTVRAGFRLGAPVAIELQGDYNHLKAWRDDDVWVITTNLRFYPSMMDEFSGILPDILQPYGVVGVGVIGGDPPDDAYQLNGAFRLGAGIDFYVTEQVALSFGYEWVTGTGFLSERDTRNLTLGVQYNF
jgi:opacity protein-like surface antigen